tara:strand:+ start:1354 stop:2172 length:819 start_codon:yes stop_codon:yes gene_type:complete
MNVREPFLFENIDLKKIVFFKTKETNGKKIIYLKYRNEGRLDDLVTQTPTLWSIKKPCRIGENLHDLEIPLVGKREENVSKFIKFLKKLDKFIIESAKNNADSWFKNSKNVTYLNTIRESNNLNIKKGFIKLKIIKSLDFKTVLKRENKFKLKVQDIEENSWMKSIIQIFAIWIKPNNQFGIYFRPIIISFKKPINNLLYNFVKETEEDDDLLPESPASDQEISNIFIKPCQVVQQTSENATSILKIDVSTFDDDSLSTTSSNNNDNLITSN